MSPSGYGTWFGTRHNRRFESSHPDQRSRLSLTAGPFVLYCTRKDLMARRKTQQIAKVQHVRVPRRSGYALMIGDTILALSGTPRFSTFGAIGKWDSSALWTIQNIINIQVEKQVKAELRRRKRKDVGKLTKLAKKSNSFTLPNSEITGRDI